MAIMMMMMILLDNELNGDHLNDDGDGIIVMILMI